MVACLGGIFAVIVAPSFSARTLEIHGTTFTSQSIIRSILGMDGAPNVFRIDTDRAAEQLVRLPAVQSASVQVRLPSTIVVNIVEREPKLVWTIGGSRYVVDQDGLLFGLVDSAGNPIASSVGPLATPMVGASSSASGTMNNASPSGAPIASPSPTPSPTPKPTATPRKSPTKPPAKATPTKAGAKGTTAPSAIASASESQGATYDASLMPSLAPAPTADPAATSGPAALGLPVVFDRRASDAGLGFGGMVDEINLDAGYRLARLTPTDVGSSAAALAVVLDDEHGFTVSSVPEGWVAEFGFYTPTVRQVTVIPLQVQTLKSLLAAYGEAHVAWVWLVGDVSGSHVNTYLPR
jgi:hypothetical protein